MKTAMVWGADGDIGTALMKALDDDGWKVLAVARHASELAENMPLVYEADVSDPYAVEQVVYQAAQEVDAIDLWIYAVGDILSRKVEDMAPADWKRILTANLSGAFYTTHFSLPLLAKDAFLLYIGAVSERLRLPGLSAYAAAKAGLEAWVESLRKEERQRRILLVRPGAVRTKLWDKVPLRLPADAPEPQKVARRLLQAYQEGETGVLDLTH